MMCCRLVGLLIVGASVAGCGAADPVAAQPNSNSDGAASQPSTPAGTSSPAPAAKVAVDDDVRKFPRLPGAKVLTETAAQVTYAAKASIAEALDFQVKELGKLGWQEVTEGNQKFANDEFAQDAFAKHGYALSLSIQKGSEPGSVQVELRSHGDVDVRKLPVYQGGKTLYGNQTTSMYTTPAKIDEVAAFTLKQLKAEGWQPYTLANSAGVENPEQKFLYLKRNGAALDVFLSVAPAQPGQTSVQYSTRALVHNLPTPKDAVAIEFDEHKPYLKFLSPTGVLPLAQFYFDNLPAVGRKPVKEASPPTEKRGFLLFDNATHRLMVSIAREDQVSVVEMREISLAALAKAAEEAEKQAAQPPATPAPPTPVEVPDVGFQIPPIDLGPAKPKAAAPNTAGPAQAFTATAAFSAKSLPLPKDAKSVDYRDSQHEVAFQSPTGVLDLVEFYRATFPDWQEDKRFSIVQPQLANFSLKKGELELTFRLVNVLNQDTDVTIRGNALQ